MNTYRERPHPLPSADRGLPLAYQTTPLISDTLPPLPSRERRLPPACETALLTSDALPPLPRAGEGWGEGFLVSATSLFSNYLTNHPGSQRIESTQQQNLCFGARFLRRSTLTNTSFGAKTEPTKHRYGLYPESAGLRQAP
jgi:hypothetical protein